MLREFFTLLEKSGRFEPYSDSHAIYPFGKAGSDLRDQQDTTGKATKIRTGWVKVSDLDEVYHAGDINRKMVRQYKIDIRKDPFDFFQERAIVIKVNEKGEPLAISGNNSLEAARRLGGSTPVKIEVRYINKSDEKVDVWEP